jgi:hypothetical protein
MRRMNKRYIHTYQNHLESVCDVESTDITCVRKQVTCHIKPFSLKGSNKFLNVSYRGELCWIILNNLWMNEWYLIFVVKTGAYYAFTKLIKAKQRCYKCPNPQPSNGLLTAWTVQHRGDYLATQPCPEDLWFNHFECGKKRGFHMKSFASPGEKTTGWTIGQPI